jgi:hypothetical protein
LVSLVATLIDSAPPVFLLEARPPLALTLSLSLRSIDRGPFERAPQNGAPLRSVSKLEFEAIGAFEF